MVLLIVAYNERGFASGGASEFRLPNPVKPLKVDEFYLNCKATCGKVMPLAKVDQWNNAEVTLSPHLRKTPC